jgi:hypothetical protein
MKAKPAIELAGMNSGGCSKDGGALFFEFEDQRGRLYEFSCPHEAVHEIARKLYEVADMARAVRGEPKPSAAPPDSHARRNLRVVTGLALAQTKGGLAVTFECGSLYNHFLLTTEFWSELQSELLSGPGDQGGLH